MKKEIKSRFLFLIGLFGATQINVIGSIGISELVVFLLAPIIYIQDLRNIRKQGFSCVLNILLLAVVNCIVGSVYNESSIINTIKGIAGVYAFFSLIVVFRRLLSDNIEGSRWFFVGYAISYVVCIFVFQPTIITSTAGSTAEAVERTMRYSLFWFNRIKMFLYIPVVGWYFKTPTMFSSMSIFSLGLWVVLTTESGRSASLGSFATSLLIMIAKKSRQKMAGISKNFVAFVVFAGIILFCLKTAYVECATHGLLGEKAQKKIEMQTKGKTDLLSILMGGRTEFFVGFVSALKQPIIGYGPWPIDKSGLVEEFLYKYGNENDYKEYLREVIKNEGKRGMIPTHSCIVGWWVWFGIMGFMFWLYVLYLSYSFFRKWVAVYPPLYGLFAVTIPPLIWDILFSPAGERPFKAIVITCLVMVKAMYEKRVENPWDFESPQIRMKYK